MITKFNSLLCRKTTTKEKEAFGIDSDWARVLCGRDNKLHLLLDKDDDELPVGIPFIFNGESVIKWLDQEDILAIRDSLSAVLECYDESEPSKQPEVEDSTQKLVIEVSLPATSEIHVHQ